MKSFKRVFVGLAPYKKYILGGFLGELFSVLFGLFSIGMMIPFLNLIFGQTEPVRDYQELSFSVDGILHYFNYQVTLIMDEYGAGSVLALIATLIVVSSILKNSFRYTSNYFLAPVRNGVIQDARAKIYHKLLTLDLSYFTGEKKGNIISRVTNDINDVENASMNTVFFMFREPINIISTLTILIILSPKLTLFVFLVLPIAGFIIGKLGRGLRQDSFNSKSYLGGLMSLVEETLSGVRVIKAFGAEGRLNKLFDSRHSTYTSIMNKVWRKQGLASPISEILGTITVALMMWYGGSQVLENMNTGNAGMSASEFLAYLFYFAQIISPAKTMSQSYFIIQKGMASYDRIDELMEAENKIVEIERPTELKDFKSTIEYKDIRFSYNNQVEVIKGFDLRIEKGQTIAFVGQSGSGKSTLADLLPRFYDVTSGSIEIDGVNVKNYSIDSLRKSMAIVNQDPILFNDTIFNNIAFGNENSTQEEVEKAARVANAHEFISSFEEGYDTLVGERGSKLSGGQKQRVSIARAVLSGADIMILDEATSALDTESEKLVQDALDKLMQNRTSIVIAHRLSTVVDADKIVVLQQGEVIETGNHEELLRLDGMYAKLYNMQHK